MDDLDLEESEAGFDALVDQVLGAQPRPIDWARLTEPHRSDQWATLEQWVQWLVSRYCLDHREIPPCWAQHGDLVEELSALHTSHQSVYDPAGSPSGPAEWHQILDNTRTRLQRWVARTGCRPNEHRPLAPPAWATGDHP